MSTFNQARSADDLRHGIIVRHNTYYGCPELAPYYHDQSGVYTKLKQNAWVSMRGLKSLRQEFEGQDVTFIDALSGYEIKE